MKKLHQKWKESVKETKAGNFMLCGILKINHNPMKMKIIQGYSVQVKLQSQEVYANTMKEMSNNQKILINFSFILTLNMV